MSVYFLKLILRIINTVKICDQWNLTLMQAPEAYDIAYGLASVRLAVIDRGIYYSDENDPDGSVHPDFFYDTGLAIESRFVSSSEWWNAEYGNNNALDISGHGTSVAGIAGAGINNLSYYSGSSLIQIAPPDEYEGIAGIVRNPNLKIIPIVHKTGGFPTIQQILSSLSWAQNHDADVINMSWYTDPDEQLDAAFMTLYEDEDIFLIASAGNGNNPEEVHYPGRNSYVMCAGATSVTVIAIDSLEESRWDDGIEGSNYGPDLDIMAPAGNTSDNDPANIVTPTKPSKGEYGTLYNFHFGATSGAAPMISGIASQILSKVPDLPNNFVKEIICRTADRVNPDTYNYVDTPGYPYGPRTDEMGYGRVNYFQALNSLKSGMITDNTTWSNFVLLVGDVNVNNATLTISPGTIIKFMPNTRLEINGQLIVDGSTDDVVFSASQDDPQPGDFHEIVINQGENVATILGTVEVNNSVTMTVSPSATVKFGQNARLEINGLLIADGGSQDILFTSNQASPSSGDWGGIYFNSSADDNSIVDNCIIEYASIGIKITSASPTIQFNIIRDCSNSGIESYFGSSPTIISNILTNTGQYGIYLNRNSEPYIQYNVISGNYYGGIYLYYDKYNDPTQILDNTLTNTGQYGIRIRYSNPFVTRNSITGANKGIYCYGYPYADFRYNSIYGNTYGVFVLGGNPTLNQGVNFDDPGGANDVFQNSSFGFYIVENAAPNLGTYLEGPLSIYGGYNDIYGNNGARAEIYHGSTADISAEYNYWGTSTPTDDDVWMSGCLPFLKIPNYPIPPCEYGTLDYQPYRTEPWDGVTSSFSYAEESSTELDLLFITGVVQEANSNYPEAAQIFQSIVTQHPNSGHARVSLERLFRIHGRAGNLQPQIAFLRQMAVNPNHPLRHLARIFWVDASLVVGRYQQVLNYYNWVINHNTGTTLHEEALFHKGMIFLDYLNDIDSAQEQYDLLAANFPDSDLLTEFNLCLTEFDNQLLPMAAKGMVRDDTQESNQLIPSEFALNLNYPNPFNPTTTIEYQLPEESMVVLKVYDIMGREIKTLINNSEQAGFRNIVWNGTDKNGNPVASGMYIYTISAISSESGKVYHQSRKMVLLR